MSDRLRQTCRKAYEPAFSMLHTLQSKTTPAAKLKVIRELADEICKCVDRAYANENMGDTKIQMYPTPVFISVPVSVCIRDEPHNEMNS